MAIAGQEQRLDKMVRTVDAYVTIENRQEQKRGAHSLRVSELLLVHRGEPLNSGNVFRDRNLRASCPDLNDSAQANGQRRRRPESP